MAAANYWLFEARTIDSTVLLTGKVKFSVSQRIFEASTTKIFLIELQIDFFTIEIFVINDFSRSRLFLLYAFPSPEDLGTAA